jgi:hypothetical protein
MGLAFVAALGADALAYGYTGYQSSWPEQTPDAIQRLSRIAAAKGARLVTPVYDITSKTEAISELKRYNLTTGALEQKCLRQLTNKALDDAALRIELEAWELALNDSISSLTLDDIRIVTECSLSDIADAGLMAP